MNSPFRWSTQKTFHLFGAAELIDGQLGYSTNANTGEPLDWPENPLVIASGSANPYCLDLARLDGDDAPVVTSEHGMGTWLFDDYKSTFVEFLEGVTHNLG